jgi:hypothetical protein
MTVEQFLKSKYTVSKVLSSLGDKVTLPSEGFVAGGSVANMLFSLYHKRNTEYFEINDIDIFNVNKLKDGESIWDKVGEDENGLVESLNLNMDVFSDDYGHVYIESNGTFYKVISADREGLINKVECIVGNRDESYHDNDIILRGFDINCCQAGIDLKTGKIHYTKQFVDFLKSKQMMVDIPYTPLHTTIRLIKKMMIYGDLCYCNLQEEFRYLHQASTLNNQECSRVIGKETYDKYKKYMKVTFSYVSNGGVKNVTIDLNDYFKLRRPLKHEIPTQYKDKHFKENHDSDVQDLWFWEPTGIFDYIDQKFNRVYELKRIWELLYRDRKKSHQKKIDMIMGFGEELKKYMFTTKTTMGSKGNTYPAKCLMVNDDYYKCDFTFKHLKEIELFFGEHRRLCNMFSKLNLQEQYEKMTMLKSLARKEGDWVIGVLENLGLSGSIKNINITKEWVDSLIEKEKQRMAKPLCEPYDLSDFKYGNCVRELTSPLDLKAEGSVMGHCVGGYSWSVEEGLSRIFHIEVDGIGSTVEVGIRKNSVPQGGFQYLIKSESDKMFSVKQHYGRYPEKGNIRPTNKNRGIAFKLCYYLAKKYLTDQEFKDTLKKYQLQIGGRYEDTFHKKRNTWKDWLGDGHSSYRKSNQPPLAEIQINEDLPF